MNKHSYIFKFSILLFLFPVFSGFSDENQDLFSEVILFYDVNSQYVKEALQEALGISKESGESIILLNNPIRDNPQATGQGGGATGSVIVGAPTIDEGVRSDFKLLGGEALVNLSSPERVQLAKKIVQRIDYRREIVDIEFELISIDRKILNETGLTLEALLEGFKTAPEEIAENLSKNAADTSALEIADVSSASLGVGTLGLSVQHTFHKLRAQVSGDLTQRNLKNLVTVIKTINLPVRSGLSARYLLATRDVIVTQNAFSTGTTELTGGVTLVVRPMIDRLRGESPAIIIDFIYSNGSVSSSSDNPDPKRLPRVTHLENKQSFSVKPGEITALSSLVSQSDESIDTGVNFLKLLPIGDKKIVSEERLDFILLLRANIRTDSQISLPELLYEHPHLRNTLLGEELLEEGYSAELKSDLAKHDIMRSFRLVSLNKEHQSALSAPLLLEVAKSSKALDETVFLVSVKSHCLPAAILSVGVCSKITEWEKKVTLRQLATIGLPLDLELEDGEHYYLIVRDASESNPEPGRALIKFVWHEDARIIEQLEQLNHTRYGVVVNEK